MAGQESKAGVDTQAGCIYVLRSKSEDPSIIPIRKLLHKVGVTSGNVEQRVANAKLDPTFLLAEVEVVRVYSLYNLSGPSIERIIHRVLGRVQLELEIKDRFGHVVRPREWFLVPLGILDEIVDRIQDGSIVDFVYSPELAQLSKVTEN